MGVKRDALRLVRRHLAEMPGYKPMDPIDVVARELGLPEERIANRREREPVRAIS
jgi:hypothetical protein